MKNKEKVPLGSIFGLNKDQVLKAFTDGIGIVHRNNINTVYNIVRLIKVETRISGVHQWVTHALYTENEDTMHYSRDLSRFHNFRLEDVTEAPHVITSQKLPDGRYSCTTPTGEPDLNFDICGDRLDVINGLWSGTFNHATWELSTAHNTVQLTNIVPEGHPEYWSYHDHKDS